MADAAKSKRREQLKRWAGSNTDREPAVPRRRRRGDARDRGAEPEAGSPSGDSGPGERGATSGRRRVRFERAAEFLAACACGDIEEAKEMLREAREKDTDEYQCGDLVNSANADGITALHQACIDGSMEVVVFLLSQGANVNQADSEGWTPLHVAASCGNVEIADFLLQNGSNVCMVNCDGDVPVDIAEDEDTEALLREHMLRQGVDVAAVKREEEEQIMKDARTWSVEGLPSDLRHPKTGATPLHVAAAKGYIEVLKLLCHCGMELSVTDTDGWTPLHAAAHWGQGDACRILAEQLCNMEAKSNAGQTPLDVADESVKALLEDLSQKQANWRNEQSANDQQQVTESAAPNTPNKNRRTSVCRMSSRDKMFVQDQSKERGVPGSLEIKEERESSPESSTMASPDNESRTISNVPAVDKCEKDAEKEERERERESRTARVQPTPQQREEGAGSTDRRIFQAPMRDEESESQRKARSRLMRQSRRSTQGVTLTDLKEAERTVSKNPENQRSIQPVSPVITVTPAERDMGPTKDGGPDGEKAMRAGAKERRRGRKERRSTGLTHLGSEEVEDGDRMEDILSDSSSTHSDPQLEDYADRSTPDYKMLYRKVLEENELIREKLQETELLLNENKVELERLRQSQENSSERPALLELERFEKRSLERKAIELQDELKVLADLRADNQRLKDENAALIRVISKLSR
ncbi:protein phosphatase 1 regulatory subunit 12C [Scleropages formosus]|uniref:Protein phosphatase 1 regulatory subunit n=1 Tax=Scleropages formosus TaxID=113540 RepID=A0A8C9R453_SCLFO|nr:protein phosphatase 1 regulatory subunit 12C-like [Scleropages formosus]